MLNFVALYGVSYLVRGPLQEPTHVYPQILDDRRRAPSSPHRRCGTTCTSGFLLALSVSLVAGWVLRRTAAGFRLIAAGESPSAATSAGGIDVMGTTTRAFLVSGALAGLAGGVEVLGVTFALYENISPGYGYTAIAVALLARLDPWRVVVDGGAVRRTGGRCRCHAARRWCAVDPRLGDRGSAHSRRGRWRGAAPHDHPVPDAATSPTVA